MPLAQITTVVVRSWHARQAKERPLVAAKSYRLLRTILNTAAADGLIVANPCTIKGAGTERTAERRIPTVETVYAIADEAGDRYRALVLTAALAGLRLGELSALTRRHVDLVHRTITVEIQAQQVAGRGRVLGPPKSKAGVRTVAVPSALADVLDAHLATFVGRARRLGFHGREGRRPLSGRTGLIASPRLRRPPGHLAFTSTTSATSQGHWPKLGLRQEK